MKVTDFVERIDEIIELGNAALQTSYRLRQNGSWVAESKFAAFRCAALSLLHNLFGPEHPYFADFDRRVSTARPSIVEVGQSILSAVRDELSGGWLTTTRGLLSAEIFSDFLDMADHLLSEHYKDAAAVMAGGALEEHLRQLSMSLGLPTYRHTRAGVKPLKADVLNGGLTKAEAYSGLDQKNVTAWLDLRNKAAHARYDDYDASQVGQMIDGVRALISRSPVLAPPSQSRPV